MVNSNDNVNMEIQSRLSEYGLVLSPVVRESDRNCFFHSISMNTISDLEKWTSWLTKLGRVDKLSLFMKLCQAFVQEILERHESYESFMISDLDYYTEANKFLQDGFLC